MFVDVGQALRLPKWERKPKVFLTSEQVKSLCEKVDLPQPKRSRHQAIMALHYLEKVTSPQLASLTVLDVDLSLKTIRKVTKRRFDKLKKLTVVYVKAYLQHRGEFSPKTDYLFVSSRGNPLGVADIRAVLNEAKKGGFGDATKL
jgi:site-specific recombinase XerD